MKKYSKVKDQFTYDFWREENISEGDMKNFIKDKILFSMGKITQSKEEIDRLVAFQYATRDQGLEEVFLKVEKEVIKELKGSN